MSCARLVTSASASVLAVMLFAPLGCGESEQPTCLEDCTAPVPVVPDPATTTPAPICADMGKERMGLGGVKLTAGRDEAVAGAERGRMKPHSALITELGRVLGEDNTPDLIFTSGDTFASAPARTYMEPAANAVSLYTAYRVAFEGCARLTGVIPNRTGKVVGDPKYLVAPTTATVQTECESWTRKFWSRPGTPDEVRACVEMAMTESLKEDQTNGSPPLDATPQRRWAYACATVLTATGFLAY